ncbi:MAG: cell division protein FtsA [Bacteroidia bacterium]|nr:MAG: cell division protein FtsA [Bacteroidia bacterium]
MSSKLMFSLDIGSSKIVSLVGTIGTPEIEILGVSSYYFVNNNKSNNLLCVRNGVVCDLEQVSGLVHQTLNEARINADCSIGGVIVNISGSKVKSLYSINSLELGNQAITDDIIKHLIDQGKQKSIPEDSDLLDYEVQEYVLDHEHYTINPIHLTAGTIEAHQNLFLASKNQTTNLTKVVKYSGFELARLVPSGILSGMSVLNQEEKELGCCLLDIGAGTTDMVIYENGFIRYLCSIPIAGEDITRDIAAVFKISRNLAEDIKLNHGSCMHRSSGRENDKISLTDHRGSNLLISHNLLVDVINERLKDIFEMVQALLKKQQIYDIINSGIVITGGSALLNSLSGVAHDYFQMPVRIGIPNYSGQLEQLIQTPKYATSLGTFYFANQYMLNEMQSGSFIAHNFGFGQMFRKIKRLLS